MESNKTSMKELAPLISEIVNDGGKFRLTVTGKSMFPTFIENRDSVILKKAGKIKRFDIILYKRDNGNYVLHRIIKIKNGVYYLCGDNQTIVEYPIRREQVIAVVEGFYRKNKYYKNNDFIYFIYSRIWGRFIPLRVFMYRRFRNIKLLFGKK